MSDIICNYLDNLSEAKILCVGDIMLDHFIYGEVERISPEAPIPVIKIAREKEMLGGVGNVIANISSLGANSYVVSVVGNDDAAKKISDKLTKIAVSSKGLITDNDRPTSLKTRFISSGQQLLRVDKEEIKPVTSEQLDIMQEAIDIAVGEFDVVVVSDYGKGVVSKEMLSRLISADKMVIVDPKGKDYSLYKGAYLITPNKKELAEATSIPTDTDEDVVLAAKYLIDNYNIKNILATRSKDGMTVVSSDGSVEHIRSSVREVFDVSGAGDTVVATVATMLLAGADLVEAAKIANIAASIVVGKVGTATVTAEEIKTKIVNDNINADIATSRKEACEEVERWKQKGLKVGFTNGCFDLIHPGHISLLQQAKSKCDRLVVGLNSDASVKRLKGDSRPVQDELSRAMVLKAMSSVDMVVIFDEDTPTELLHELQPDLLVKGGDYRLSEVVGADFVMSYGGEVFLAKIEEGQSTTSIIERSA